MCFSSDGRFDRDVWIFVSFIRGIFEKDLSIDESINPNENSFGQLKEYFLTMKENSSQSFLFIGEEKREEKEND